MTNAKHVILGAGTVGTSAAAALLQRSQEVLVVSRRRPAGLPAAVRHVAADVRDAEALRRACAGAKAVYQCLNAPYHRWRKEFPPMQRAVVAAARAVGARLVSFENVYPYGLPGAAPFAEDHPLAACSEKGRIRAEMVEELRGLQARGELEVVHVRASDLFGPGMLGSALGSELVGRAVEGKPARGLGDLDAPHTWTFTADAGETLASAGTPAGGGGRVWHVPSDAPRSQRQVAAELGRILGRGVTIQATPAFVLRLVGLFQPAAAELVEMAYEFDRPFVVGDQVTRAALGVGHTPFAEALAATVRWYRAPRAAIQAAPLAARA